jgi:polar amino acid transport system substrate-binding protein
MGIKHKLIPALMPLVLLSVTASTTAQTNAQPMGHESISGPAPVISPKSNHHRSNLPVPPAVASTQQGPNATQCTKLRASGAVGWEPVTYLDDRRVARGLGVDILQEFAARSGIDLEVNLDIPWNRAMLMLANGEIDVMAGAYFTQQRDRQFFYSLPFASDDIVVFQNTDHVFEVNDVGDLVNRRGARPQGGSYGDYLDQYAKDHLDIIFSPTGNRILDLLINQRVDYVMLGRYDGLANIANDNISDQIHMVEPPLVANPVMFMFSRKSPCMKMVPPLNTFVNHLEQSDRLTEMTATHLPILPQN